MGMTQKVQKPATEFKAGDRVEIIGGARHGDKVTITDVDIFHGLVQYKIGNGWWLGEQLEELDDPLAKKIEERNNKPPILEGKDFNHKPETVNHPPHYQADGMEAIDVIEAFNLDFSEGSAIKYILRARKKGNSIEDWNKAIWYLERLIANERIQ